ncbi:TauD/TfdA family dioxygenase [Streptomyces sp. NPDC051662]|uniref:TauD/TfdA family dioxygenase n=1 Tax=Streptomyces sp. NPDC051662 TaxID=3154750 RepID=UPI00341F968F
MVLQPPSPPPLRLRAGAFPARGGKSLVDMVREHGFASARLGSPLPVRQLLRFGSMLGTPQPETDPAVLPFTEEQVVLNLCSVRNRTEDPAMQPFARDALALHSEGSGRGIAQQPRYIVLMCRAPGGAAAALTVLVSMAEVASRLDREEKDLLRAIAYRAGTPPPVLRYEDGRPVFSFRDFMGQRLLWRYTPGPHHAPEPEPEPERVNAVLRRLLAAMYTTRAAGVRWEAGLLIVVDNRRFFHGRTAAPASGVGLRHLQRLRIV